MPKTSIFDDRNEYTEQEQEDFDGGYTVRYDVGTGLWITVVNNKRGDGRRLFYLELAWQSSYTQFGLRNGQKLWIDDSTPWLRAAQRTYREHNKPGNYEWYGKKVNGALNAWRSDRVAWLAVNVIDAAIPESWRGRLQDWVYQRYANPHCPVYLEPEDFSRQTEIYATKPEE